ncbi:MAG: GNAT family N-acetyltransferase [Bacteriovoracaceae bacterium]
MQILEKKRDNFLISTNQELLDLNQTHQMIAESYWATNIPKDIFERSVRNSLCFGLYDVNMQIGFARVITDYATFAYLGDVFITSKYRGMGLSKWLMDSIMEHPDLQGLRRFCLGTKDAHGLYEKYGFESISNPKNWMEIKIPDIYLR